MSENELPANWIRASLSELGTWAGGGTPSKSEPSFWNGSIPWVSPKDMKTEFISDTEEHITPTAIEQSATRLIPAESVLVVTRSGILERTLPVATTKKPVTINQDLKALTPREGVRARYVALGLKAFEQRILKDCTKSGTTVANVEFASFLRFGMPLAPTGEQDRIIAEAEKQFTRLDASVEALKRVQAQLKRYRASVLKAACEGRLIPTEAELARRETRDYEPADRVLARNKMEIAVLGTESVSLPEGWCWTTIARTIEIIDYRGRTPPYSEAGIPHLRSSNVRDGRIVWENLRFVTQATYDQYMTRGIPRVGDLLFSTEAPLGELAPVPNAPFSLAQRLMVLRPDPRVWDAAFLMYQMMSPSFRARLTQRGTGSTVTGVSSRNFQPLPLAVPPLAEQRRIVSEVEARLSATSAAASMIDASLRRAGSLRNSVLKAAFEGSLVPQDPRDEPASKLLERISAAVENKFVPKQGRAKQTTAAPKMKATR